MGQLYGQPALSIGLLESHRHLAQAAASMAVLPPVGALRWCGSAGEHGKVYGEQLLCHRILEILAQVVQFMGDQVRAPCQRFKS